MDDLQKRGRRAFAVKGMAVSAQLVQHNAGGEDIGPRVHRLAIDLLGRHVADAAHNLPGSGNVLRSNVSDTKIHDLDHTLFRNHDVGRLDIAMHDATAMRVAQTVADFDNEMDLF